MNTKSDNKAGFILSFLKKNAMLVILILVYLFFVARTGGKMFKASSFETLIKENAYVFILASGMLMCMLTGGNIDLSCGSFVCLLGAIGGLLIVNFGWSPYLAILAMLVVGIAYGCLLGYIIAFVNVPPWIATLAGYLSFRGLGTYILATGSSTSAFPMPKEFVQLFAGKIFSTKPGVFNWPCMSIGIVAAAIVIISIFRTRSVRLKKGYEADSLVSAAVKSFAGAGVLLLVAWKLANAGGFLKPLIWVAVVVLIYSFITSKTTIGRHFYVVGGNREAARLSGVNTRMIMFLAYLNMAVITVITSWISIARFQAANSTVGNYYEMDAISACVVGGVSAYGGAGSVMGMIIGATLIGIINLGMVQINIDSNFRPVIKGFVLLAAVVFDILSKRKKS